MISNSNNSLSICLNYIWRQKCFKQGLAYFEPIMRRQGFLEKTMLRKVEGSRKRGQRNVRWISSLKEATGLSVQELSRAVEKRTFWKRTFWRSCCYEPKPVF